jgi:ergothioneine biosynthesis protein EgtB
VAINTDFIYSFTEFDKNLGTIMYIYKETNSDKAERTEDKQKIRERFVSGRKFTEELCRSLIAEDYVIQSMPDASPVKWHLAHTTWFFETFILSQHIKNYAFYNNTYKFLFNSYYVQEGERYARAKRGMLSRPGVEEVYNFRQAINERMINLIETTDPLKSEEINFLIELGLNHEQQHQELILTDIKHLLSLNPLRPEYSEKKKIAGSEISGINWISFPEGIYETGNRGREFVFDNETPRHKTFIPNFSLADRLITNKEYIDFIEEGGYRRAELWLSDGWNIVESEKWNSPLYWEKVDTEWWTFTLSGFNKIVPDEPICHISLFEADAYAHWSGARLPTEDEWEAAAYDKVIKGNFAENGYYHPVPLLENVNGFKQLFGDVWEWTRSSYSPYPGYKTLPGALGEYNGKFMSGQIVLRGGSCATPVSHIRPTYRNFFPPGARWQFTGLRLAKDEV